MLQVLESSTSTGSLKYGGQFFLQQEAWQQFLSIHMMQLGWTYCDSMLCKGHPVGVSELPVCRDISAGIMGQRSIKVISDLDAPIIVIPKFVQEGDDLDIFCRSGDAYPDPILNMHKDDQLISSTNGTTLKYTIINATSHDHGFYYCEAHNKAGSKTSNGVTLSMHYIRCQQKSDVNIIVAEGDSVSIPCQVNAQPNPNYTFFKNNKVVKSGYVKEYMIEKATEEDTGNYHCMAVNNAGNVTCGQKNLLVPYCLISTFSLIKGHLTCVAEGQPEPNTTITVNGDVVANGKMTSTYGVVSCNVVAKCVAENGYSKTTKMLKSCKTSGVSGNVDMTTDVPLVGIMLGILGFILTIICIVFIIKHRSKYISTITVDRVQIPKL
ncbi:hemicentin-1-like [Anneissia japonica]|uniref:hemicentin-1-like n=1 Tax=Anneissia japonica TaxID=1529436 RepID=UPI0014255A8D|nr:hemicentin-1-like [Anneissia japonica]